jgi:hypothetical protein
MLLSVLGELLALRSSKYLFFGVGSRLVFFKMCSWLLMTVSCDGFETFGFISTMSVDVGGTEGGLSFDAENEYNWKTY